MHFYNQFHIAGIVILSILIGSCTPVPLFDRLRNPLQNLTLFRALAQSSPNPTEAGMCRVNGTIIARISHFDRLTTMLAGLIEKLVSEMVGTDAQDENMSQMSKYLMSDGNEGASITFRVGNHYHVPSGAAGEHGIVRPVFEISVPCTVRWIPIDTMNNLKGFDHEKLQIISETGFSVITDVDDTIRLAGVLDIPVVLKKTFLDPYEPTPNFVQFCNTLHSALNVPAWHYVSGSPHQLYIPIRQFIRNTGYPPGSVFLQNGELGFWTRTQDHKLREIRGIFDLFPRRSYVLVGDSGELDPETYGIISRDTPHVDIKCIYIRLVAGFNPDKEAVKNAPSRFEDAFHSLPRDKWVVFSNPAELVNADIPNGKCK